ncbi:SpoIIE family protein phosphatase, partial [Desulfococcaceae bacterium HSG8]|nr:SpoIIE family protein phosphatase [Desulfococcaceae bacterium HSG8]
ILPRHVPIIGFYGHGEFSPLTMNGPSRLHNATMVTLLVGTKDNDAPAKPASLSCLNEPSEYGRSPEQLELVNQFLQKKLRRSEGYRERLELNKDLNAALLRKINQEIEEANKKIMDSIRYAKMIQQSFLLNPEPSDICLARSFVIWQPKDVIGGDFFYTESFEDGFIAAIIDCTGHGVPGALMTMLASSALKRIVRDEGCHDPSRILSRLNFTIKTSLRQDTGAATSDDGLDAAVCFVSGQLSVPSPQPSVLSPQSPVATGNGLLTFAGARLPLIYILNGELNVIKGDRQSIGYKKSDVNFEFTSHTISVESGMSFYMSTDGFADQMGGQRNRRLGTRKFHALLKANSGKPFNEQREALIRAFEAHKGENERQDDVTVMGFSL